jgi:hypothetical protein
MSVKTSAGREIVRGDLRGGSAGMTRMNNVHLCGCEARQQLAAGAGGTKLCRERDQNVIMATFHARGESETIYYSARLGGRKQWIAYG